MLVEFNEKHNRWMSRPDDVPQAGEIYAHMRTGNLYKVVLVANLNSTREGYPVLVNYTDIQGNVWAKELAKFNKSMQLSKRPWPIKL